MTEQRTDDRERGAASTEHVGIVAVVVTIVLVLVAVGAPPVGGAIAARLCAAFGATCGSTVASSTGSAPEDYVPPEACVAEGDGGSLRGSVAAGVQVEGGVTWFVEALGDGRYRLTRSDDEVVGAEVGAGFDVSLMANNERYGVALTAGVNALRAMEEGDVFYVDSEDEADAMVSAALADAAKDALIGEGGLDRTIVDWITQASDREQVVPDETYVSSGTRISAFANGTLSHLVSGDAGAKVEVGVYEGTRTRTDDSTTDYFSASSKGAANAAFGGFGNADGELREDSVYGMDSADASYDGSIKVEVDRDDDGVPTAMRLKLIGSAQGQVVGDDEISVDPTYEETTWQVPLDTTEHREAAARVALGLGLEINDVTNQLGPLDVLSPLDYGASWSDYQAAARQDGHAWNQTYELGSVTNGANVDAKAIAKAGFAGSYTGTTRRALEYTYWDGSGYVTRAGCIGG